MNMQRKLQHLGLTPLPPPFPPVGEYLQVVIIGHWLYISGTGPWPDGPPPHNKPMSAPFIA